MNKIILSGVFLLMSNFVLAAELFSLKSDKNTYLPNEAALLVTNVKTLPTSKNFEVVIITEFNSQKVEAVKISPNTYLTKIGDVGVGTNLVFKGKYFLRNKYLFEEYAKGIIQSEERIYQLVKSRRMATSAERVQIEAQISSEDNKISFLLGKQDSLLRLVEEKVITANVGTSQPKLNESFLFLTTDREDRIYSTGEVLTLFGHVYLNVSDKGTVLKGHIGTTNLTVEKLQKNEFMLESGALESGIHVAQIHLYLRDELRGERLNEALMTTESEIIRLNNRIAQETNPVKLARLQKELSKLIAIKAHIKALLSSLEQLIETVNYKFTVEEAQ